MSGGGGNMGNMGNSGSVGNSGGGGGVQPAAFSNTPITQNQMIDGAVMGNPVQALSTPEITQALIDGNISGKDAMTGDSGFSLSEGSLRMMKGSTQVARFEMGTMGTDMYVYNNPDGSRYMGGFQSLNQQQQAAYCNMGMNRNAAAGGGSMMTANGTCNYNMSYTDQALVLNTSDNVNLEFSTFGFWAVNCQQKMQVGSNNFMDISRVDRYCPLTGGNTTNLKSPAPDAAFTGKATALAHRDGRDYDPGILIANQNLISPIDEYIFGDAALAVGTSGSAASLALTFPGFYNITYSNLGIAGSNMADIPNTSSLTIAENNSPTATQNRNASGFALTPVTNVTSSGSDNYVKGQFYGNGANASEAVGTFGVGEGLGGGRSAWIQGSFGVKQ